jgi:hypothetical protein
MADRFKASKFGQAIAADLAAPLEKSEVGDKHHGKDLVRIFPMYTHDMNTVSFQPAASICSGQATCIRHV